jgi:septum formation inhibitor MinC
MFARARGTARAGAGPDDDVRRFAEEVAPAVLELVATARGRPRSAS